MVIRILYMIIFVFSILQQGMAQDPGRNVLCINDDWQFYRGELNERQRKDKTTRWVNINLPHCYNKEDPFDDEPGYYRGETWYKRNIDITDFYISGRYFLYFEAINQEATIYVNEQEIGSHQGGYTAFAFDITEALTTGENLLEIRVNNRHNPDIPPLKGDFNFYGGIYRDVYLIETNKIHFDLEDHGSSGVYINTPDVSEERAQFNISSRIINSGADPSNVLVHYFLRNRERKVIIESTKSIRIDKEKWILKDSFLVQNPILWHPNNPYLYQLEIVLVDEEGEILDRIKERMGFRYFHFDPDEGFFLNGKSLKLMGVNRHQDMEGKGNALENADHYADVKMIKQMGANFLRTAHYPQDPAVINACDSLGLLVSIEIPLDHEITDSKSFAENCKVMMKEMIRQNYNHPSVIIWAYMNEMFLGKDLKEDKAFIQNVVELAKELETLTRQEDPYRYTMIPNHGAFDIYFKSGLTDIPMIVGWNLYFGWYVSDFQELTSFLTLAHNALPQKSFIISEYGAGADPRIRNEQPKRFDFSIDWQNNFHKSHIHQIKQLDFVAGAAVWNMFDFGSEMRQDAVPRINSKGLCTFDRKPKEAFFIYRDSLAGSISLDVYEQDVLLDLSIRKNYGTGFVFTSDTLIQWLPELSEEDLTCFGGTDFSPRKIGYGTARSIKLSPDDPLYQTQIIGPDSLQFSVFSGYNTIELLFAELEDKGAGERVFDVVINDDFVFTNIDLSAQFGTYTAVSKKITIDIPSNELKIVFKPIKGTPLINAIQITPNLK